MKLSTANEKIYISTGTSSSTDNLQCRIDHEQQNVFQHDHKSIIKATFTIFLVTIVSHFLKFVWLT